MLLVQYLLVLISVLIVQVKADEVWARGVNKNSGWYDYNKTIANTDDDNLCWAASASNVINWWQDRYPNVFPAEGVPEDEEVWETYQAAAERDDGGEVKNALQWWLVGEYSAEAVQQDNKWYATRYGYYLSSDFQSEEGAVIQNSDFTQPNAFEGYIAPLPGVTVTDWYSAVRACLQYKNILTLTPGELIANLLEGNAISLSIMDTTMKISHAITLWGADYTKNEDESYTINTLWLTDSDDAQNGYNMDGLFSVQMENDNPVQYTIEDDPTKYSALTFAPEDGSWYDAVLAEDQYLFITGAAFLSLEESDTWWENSSVPEPSVPLLAGMALGALCLRRRRAGEKQS